MATTGNNRRKPRKRSSPARKKSSAGGLWPWLVALVVVAGVIVAYDNRQHLPGLIASYLPKAPQRAANRPADAVVARSVTPQPRTEPATAKPSKPVDKREVGPVPPAPIGVTAVTPPAAVPVPGGRPGDPSEDGKGFTGKFYFCGTSGLDNCVASGDSFWFRKGRILLADVVAPGTEEAKCQQERDKGFAAKVRLRELLNAGRFDLSELKGQNVPAIGPLMRVVTRDGRSLGAVLVSEGLAQPRFGKRQSWCP
ncbi:MULTISPECIES: nuclease [Alphaproteobacteria]|uniref:Membrane protein n=2 Tax=Alphaproteobacteria TaxID=28211 RepID=A0A512HHJ4_9HYPH|nr:MULTISPECIES: nuclease [Alphaproteobacteria]GEO84918.1 membrane protein [Ciceribacter naphthalenivorans]GLR22852.1 membrane protein [Ciceribacter naphthalenivorans]GLT05708.1 membrane protein [Sphingomonas psychrolutea]